MPHKQVFIFSECFKNCLVLFMLLLLLMAELIYSKLFLHQSLPNVHTSQPLSFPDHVKLLILSQFWIDNFQCTRPQASTRHSLPTMTSKQSIGKLNQHTFQFYHICRGPSQAREFLEKVPHISVGIKILFLDFVVHHLLLSLQHLC